MIPFMERLAVPSVSSFRLYLGYLAQEHTLSRCVPDVFQDTFPGYPVSDDLSREGAKAWSLGGLLWNNSD